MTMARYIDADDLKHDIAVLFKNNEELIDRWLACRVDNVIDEHKACGGVDLVRCKDCKHWKTVGACVAKFCTRIVNTEIMKYEDDYCSLGERRTDDAKIH